MTHSFDPGYGTEPFRALVADYPDDAAYPPDAFRTEWGPIFHRGRLDGTARILIIGQDPATHETVTRRILVGEAGQRIQGFLTRLGITTSYVLINTFLYSVYGQGGGEAHIDDPKISAYRNRWIDAILASSPVEAIVTLGHLANKAHTQWSDQHAGTKPPHVAITHPTYPESASASGQTTKKAAMKLLCANWNTGLAALKPIVTPDKARTLKKYGDTIAPTDLTAIPEADLPPGLPAWMRGLQSWATRGDPPASKLDPVKRAILRIDIPSPDRTWPN